MGTALLSVRVNSDDKRRFEDFCSEAGMNMSVAIKMFIKAPPRENRLRFGVRGDPFYNEANMKHLQDSVSQIETRRSTLKEHELIRGTNIKAWSENSRKDYAYCQSQDKRL